MYIAFIIWGIIIVQRDEHLKLNLFHNGGNKIAIKRTIKNMRGLSN